MVQGKLTRRESNTQLARYKDSGDTWEERIGHKLLQVVCGKRSNLFKTNLRS